jgi:anti-sigma factor RsiW
MSGIETEIERIEESLDGAMGQNEVVVLRERIAAEPALAELMEHVRGERAARAAVYAGLEPGDTEAQALADQIISTARRSVPPQHRVPWRSAIAVAACMVIGFFAGWAWRGGVRRSAGVSPNHGIPTAVATYRVALTDEQGRVTAVQDFDSLEKAREFTHDVDQWQARQRQMRDGAAVIVADQF